MASDMEDADAEEPALGSRIALERMERELDEFDGGHLAADPAAEVADSPSVDELSEVESTMSPEPEAVHQNGRQPPANLVGPELERFYAGQLTCMRVDAHPELMIPDLGAHMRGVIKDVRLLNRLTADERYMHKLRSRFHAIREKPCVCFGVLFGACADFFNAMHYTMAAGDRRRGKPDFGAQNRLLESLLFDYYGNTLYHGQCAQAIFGVTPNRLLNRRQAVRVMCLTTLNT